MSSSENALTDFGLIIAYVLPGFTALFGLPFLTDESALWGAAALGTGQSIADLLAGALGALAVGLTVSAFRWLLIDSLHHLTGLRRPRWDFGKLATNPAAFQLLIDHHYRYYKFYGLCGVPHKPYYADHRIMRRLGTNTDNEPSVTSIRDGR